MKIILVNGCHGYACDLYDVKYYSCIKMLKFIKQCKTLCIINCLQLVGLQLNFSINVDITYKKNNNKKTSFV